MEFSQTEKIVAQFFVEREGEEILKVIKKIDFVDEGILDSLDIISLADYLQKNSIKKLMLQITKLFKHFIVLMTLLS